jgi:hypothetical protein
MDLYTIVRRNAWKTPEDLEAAAARSNEVNAEMADDVRWIRSYILAEEGGASGSMCIYEATGPEAIREHARRSDMPADEIIAIADTVVVNDDPQAAA